MNKKEERKSPERLSRLLEEEEFLAALESFPDRVDQIFAKCVATWNLTSELMIVFREANVNIDNTFISTHRKNANSPRLSPTAVELAIREQDSELLRILVDEGGATFPGTSKSYFDLLFKSWAFDEQDFDQVTEILVILTDNIEDPQYDDSKYIIRYHGLTNRLNDALDKIFCTDAYLEEKEEINLQDIDEKESLISVYRDIYVDTLKEGRCKVFASLYPERLLEIFQDYLTYSEDSHIDEKELEMFSEENIFDHPRLLDVKVKGLDVLEYACSIANPGLLRWYLNGSIEVIGEEGKEYMPMKKYQQMCIKGVQRFIDKAHTYNDPDGGYNIFDCRKFIVMYKIIRAYNGKKYPELDEEYKSRVDELFKPDKRGFVRARLLRDHTTYFHFRRWLNNYHNSLDIIFTRYIISCVSPSEDSSESPTKLIEELTNFNDCLDEKLPFASPSRFWDGGDEEENITSLEYTCENKKLELVQALVHVGANVRIGDTIGCTLPGKNIIAKCTGEELFGILNALLEGGAEPSPNFDVEEWDGIFDIVKSICEDYKTYADKIEPLLLRVQYFHN